MQVATLLDWMYFRVELATIRLITVAAGSYGALVSGIGFFSQVIWTLTFSFLVTRFLKSELSILESFFFVGDARRILVWSQPLEGHRLDLSFCLRAT